MEKRNRNIKVKEIDKGKEKKEYESYRNINQEGGRLVENETELDNERVIDIHTDK